MKQKQLYNAFASLLKQFVVIVVGLILPRLIISHYGSEANGLVASITNFLAFITFAELGIGAVVQSALYKPLANKNELEISRIIVSASKFYSIIAIALIVYSLILAIVFPYIGTSPYSKNVTGILVVAISISLLSKYMLGIVPEIVLTADRMIYIPKMINIFELILNCFVSVLLIISGYSLVAVELISSIILCIRPVLLRIIVNRHYHIDYHATYSEEPIKQKWNGIAQHIAAILVDNTDVALLTFFSSYSIISVYSIYSFVTIGIRGVILALTSGLMAILGYEYAVGDLIKLNKVFAAIECYSHLICSILFSCTLVLISSFIKLYTKNIADINYVYPIFACFITIAQFFYCLRLPYKNMVLAAGHYKETQTSAIIEVVLNISVSLILVGKYNLIGVAIGTIIAMAYRTLYFVFYLSKQLLNRSIFYFLKHFILDLVVVIAVFVCSQKIMLFIDSSINWLHWLFMSGITFIISALISLILNYIFFKKDFLRIRSIFTA